MFLRLIIIQCFEHWAPSLGLNALSSKLTALSQKFLTIDKYENYGYIKSVILVPILSIGGDLTRVCVPLAKEGRMLTIFNSAQGGFIFHAE
jgi:hypothetical protein